MGTAVTVTISVPDGIPASLILVALRLQNGNQHGTKHLKMDELQPWGALLSECITKALTCKSLSKERQKQTCPEPCGLLSTSHLPLPSPEFNRRRASPSVSQPPQKVQFKKRTKVQGGYFPVSHPELVCLDQNKLQVVT